MNFLFKAFYIGKYKIEVPVFIWFLLAVVASLIELSRGEENFNNFLLYKHVFIHTTQQVNLYNGLPENLFDNHYGPFFSIVMAPFSFVGNYIGCFLWCIANAWILYMAISKLPINRHQQLVVLLITAVEMMTATHNVQFNTMLAGWIILSFIYVEKEKEIGALIFIAAGFLVKILGVVGIGFFIFSKHKKKFILFGILWLLVLGFMPAIISSPSFVVQSYIDWYYDLIDKNQSNVNFIVNNMQDISVMGMIRRIFHVKDMPNWMVLLPAAIAYILPIFRYNEFKNLSFRLSYLAMALIGVVIFSSSAESPTYVIAVSGVAIWYVIQKNSKSAIALFMLIFTLVLTVFSPTDLFPAFIRKNYVMPYALKALPCFAVWLTILYQLITQKFSATIAD